MKTLFDNHGRPVNYLRLSVTDRCNLRCAYCMPEKGVKYQSNKELLTLDEHKRLISIMASLGITKVRFTGGEPFTRPDFMDLVRLTSQIETINSMHITSNGILMLPHITELKNLGVASINLSLDTLKPDRFLSITKRDELEKTLEVMHKIINQRIELKLNMVVMDGKNDDEILDMVMLTQKLPIAIRFIEQMPFNGEQNFKSIHWTYPKLLQHIKSTFPALTKIEDENNATAYNYKIPGYAGTIGIIAGYTRSFCGSCNRIRITSQGELKTCLYDQGVLNIKRLLRDGLSDDEICDRLLQAFSNRAKDGFEAARRNTTHETYQSMSVIGG